MYIKPKSRGEILVQILVLPGSMLLAPHRPIGGSANIRMNILGPHFGVRMMCLAQLLHKYMWTICHNDVWLFLVSKQMWYGHGNKRVFQKSRTLVKSPYLPLLKFHSILHLAWYERFFRSILVPDLASSIIQSQSRHNCSSVAMFGIHRCILWTS